MASSLCLSKQTKPLNQNKVVKRNSTKIWFCVEKPCSPTAMTVSAQVSHITCPSLGAQSVRRDKHGSGALCPLLFCAYPRPLPSPGLCPDLAWLPVLFYGSPSPLLAAFHLLVSFRGLGLS